MHISQLNRLVGHKGTLDGIKIMVTNYKALPSGARGDVVSRLASIQIISCAQLVFSLNWPCEIPLPWVDVIQ